jgi:hypothetical protein
LVGVVVSSLFRVTCLDQSAVIRFCGKLLTHDAHVNQALAGMSAKLGLAIGQVESIKT